MERGQPSRKWQGCPLFVVIKISFSKRQKAHIKRMLIIRSCHLTELYISKPKISIIVPSLYSLPFSIFSIEASE